MKAPRRLTQAELNAIPPTEIEPHWLEMTMTQRSRYIEHGQHCLSRALGALVRKGLPPRTPVKRKGPTR